MKITSYDIISEPNIPIQTFTWATTFKPGFIVLVLRT